MRVFSSFKQVSHQSSSSKKRKGPLRPTFSESEVRQKLAERTQKKNAPKKVINPEKGKQVSEFMSGKPGKIVAAPKKAPMEPSEADDKAKKLVHSDIEKNDPSDPHTGEKLKHVLRNGSFSFSDKEKAALGKILGLGEES